MQQINVGDGSGASDSGFVALYVSPGGGGTTVTNLSGGSTLNVYTTLEAGASSTINAGSNATFTQGPVWIQSQGISTVQLTGTGF